MKRSILLTLLSLFALAGCATPPLSCDDGRDVRWFSSPLDHALNNGMKNYEEGNYAGAISILQGLVDNKQASKAQKLEAYKFMAFSYCLSPRDEKKMCKESFKKAFEIEATFDLLPAEAGHPVWGPVFKSVKIKPVK